MEYSEVWVVQCRAATLMLLAQDSVAKLQARHADFDEVNRESLSSWNSDELLADGLLAENLYAHCCLWYALLFHRSIDTLPQRVVSDVRLVVDTCMRDEGVLACRFAWAPHTHLLFPHCFQVCVCRLCCALDILWTCSILAKKFAAAFRVGVGRGAYGGGGGG